MKYEWKKNEKNLYLPKNTPELINVPNQNFFMIDGTGDPNGENFSNRVEVLYALSYAIRMMPKRGVALNDYFEYTVYPLEGVWDLTEEGRKSDAFKKDDLIYTIMIRQPEFVTLKIAKLAIEYVKNKKVLNLLDKVRFDSMEDGLSVQMLHIGSYDDEYLSFKKMKDFINQNSLEILTLKHREIYLSDARKVDKSKLKTVLRYRVKKK